MADKVLIGEAQADRGVLAQVLHPVAPLTAAREQVDDPAAEREPDLDRVRGSRAASGRRDVTEVELGEVAHARRRPTRSARRSRRSRRAGRGDRRGWAFPGAWGWRAPPPP